MTKLQLISALAEYTAKEISSSPRDWMRYLDTASRLYRYPFQDTLLIYAQRPKAAACVSLETWNRKVNRWVKRGAKGIVLIDDTGPKRKLKYVFDVADTYMMRGCRGPNLWKLMERQRGDLLAYLKESHGLNGEDGEDLPAALKEIASRKAEENLTDAMEGLKYETKDTFLEDLDGDTIRVNFRNLLTDSAFYALSVRCGLDPMEYLEEEDFVNITDFNTLPVLTFLGNAVNRLIEPVLMEIGQAVRKIYLEERQKAVENAESIGYNKFSTLKRENERGGTGYGTDIPPQGRLPVPEPNNRAGAGEHREIRDAAEDIPERAPAGLVPGHDAVGETGQTPDGNGQSGRGEDGDHDEGAAPELSGTGQGEGPDGVGGPHEQPESHGRGEYLTGTDIHLNENTDGDLSEAEEETASALSLPQLPTVEQQVREIEERIQALYAGEISISPEVVDEVLRTGGGRKGSHLRIIYNFMLDRTPEEYTESVRREYGTGGIGLMIGGREYAVWHDESGMQIAQGHTVTGNVLHKAFLSWEEVSGRIHRLLKQGEYAPQEILDAARPNALLEGAQALAYMKADMAEGIAETVFEDSKIFAGGFPEKVERLKELLSRPEFVSEVTRRLSLFADAYREDKSVMRFHFYRPDRILVQLQKLEKEAVPYRAGEGFRWEKPPVFITQDETDAFLAGGGPFSNGRLSTYAFFIQDRTDKEKTDFIRERYGTGGNSHALGGADDTDAWYDGKGLRLTRGSGENKAEVMLKWTAVAKRVAYLIDHDRFLKAADFSRMPGYEREQMAGLVYQFYFNLPEDIRRPWGDSLFLPGHTEDMAGILEDPQGREVLLKFMDQALAALPEDFEDYRQKVKILADLHGYAEGTYTIFPEREKEVEMGDSVQLSLFDFLEMDTPVRERQEAEETEEARTEAEEEVQQDKQAQQEQTERKEQKEPERAENLNLVNFRITDDNLGTGGPKQKFRANMDAILLLKRLEEENRQAAPEEQEILSRFVGWGGLPSVFEEGNGTWAAEHEELKQILTEEEFRQARASTLNAFYTSPTVIKAMYEVLENMGLKQGNVLEPSCGVGNFMGLVPDGMDGIRMYGVELDSISGRIAKQLYPNNNISIQGFETKEYPDSFFDCVIGNIPFGAYQVPAKKYDRYHFLIHDYFIAKSLDLVRPGGVVAVVTSSGTMDKQNTSVRQYIANRADLLGAIRLPNNAFRSNAGTEVVSDILFFQKRDRASIEQPEWVELGTTPEGYTVNKYYVNHPEMVLGKFSMEHTQYGKQEVTVRPVEGAVLSKQLKEAASHIKGEITDTGFVELESEEMVSSIPADPSIRNFSFADVGGQVYYRENSRMNLMELPGITKERVLGMVRLRDVTQELIRCQLEDGSNEEIEELQRKLNQMYDSFTANYGLIGSNANRRAFSQDGSYYLLSALELTDEDGNLIRKADIFTKRTIRRAEPVTSVDTASEALGVSIGERARVDIPFMAKLAGKTEDEITEELKGVIFQNPLTDQWETADEYLSGNVREKLGIAMRAAESRPEMQINVQHLKKVQPRDLDASEIEVRLGATWIGPSYITEFMGELLHTPKNYLGSKIQVKYAQINGQWAITEKNLDAHGNSLVTSTYGTRRANAYRLLEDALNLRDTKIYDTVTEDGKEKRILNKEETMIAQQKQEMIKEAFREWVFRDMDRREELCKTYNELYNSIRPREYDGSHIRFVGMNPEIVLMQHQKNAVAHILYGGNTLLAHCVGAGKTFEMVAAGMESRRLGLSQKNLYVVPNHLTEQWGSDFMRLYPGANILVATKKDFEPANRKKFCSRIATGDYDGIIIGHSQFERIPLSTERQIATIERQIEDITEAMEKAAREAGMRYTVKQMEKTKKSLEARLERLNDQTRKDDVVTFEELGVDRLFVDESHNYKNMFLYTKMRNVAGISQTDAQKSSDMFMKCRYLDELTGGRGVTFATGTPISNSMVELYTIMRYLQYDTLQKLGLGHFDSWAAAFGETITGIELSPEGTGYRAKTRFARFYNLPELMALFKECADIQTADMLNLPVPEAEYVNEVLKPSREQKEMVSAFAERAEIVRKGGVNPSADNMLKITNDGRKCALDQRLLNELLPDNEESKVNCCVRNAFEVWKRTMQDKSTQLIFCDLSTPKSNGEFNIYDDVRNKLAAMGIPKEEIAFIHEAGTETKKAELFAKVRSGQVRILLGSTPKLGAGTNVQDRLIALHHLDCPWKPSELEQQEGRILRQGNQNEKVTIFRYVTEATFDAYMWQTLENKQKFISQIMTSKSPVRSCEDVDDTALSYAEIKALATGNVHIKEKMALDIEVSKLKLLKANHTSQKYRLEAEIAKNYPLEIAALTERIAGLKADIAMAAPMFDKQEDHFSIVIGKRAYTDRKEAGEALIDACRNFKEVGTAGQIGNFHGFALIASYDSFYLKYMLNVKGNLSHQIEVGKDPLGNMLRISNALTGMERKLAEAEAKLTNVRHQLATAQEEIKKPFAREEELKEKLERLSELNILLNMDDKGSPEAIALDEDAGEEKPSVLGKLSAAKERINESSKDGKKAVKGEEQEL